MSRQHGRGEARTADTVKRISRFLARSVDLTADSVQRVDGGRVILTPSLPQVWSLNHLKLEAKMPWRRALEVADRHLGQLPYRHVVAEDELGREVAAALDEQGFKVEREVVMALADGPHARPPAAEVVEADEAAVLEIERRWLSEDERLTSAEAVAQLLEAGLREGRALGERRFGIAGEGETLAAITKLRSNERTAQVEDVYTVPEARGRGFASTLVAHAARAAQRAGHDLIFIVADDNDWPKHLYARLGFQPAGLRWMLHREAAM